MWRVFKIATGFAQFIHPRFKTMTPAFAEYTGRWMEETTIAAVERMTSCSGMSHWRLDQWRMKTMKKMFEVPTDMPMSFASADEVHMRTIKPKDARFDKSKWKKRFINAATELCPNAKITVDRFHVAEALNRAFDELRKQEFENAKK